MRAPQYITHLLNLGYFFNLSHFVESRKYFKITENHLDILKISFLLFHLQDSKNEVDC